MQAETMHYEKLNSRWFSLDAFYIPFYNRSHLHFNFPFASPQVNLSVPSNWQILIRLSS
jgi:hypothetical protein